jgi:radical SAM superfamily enzyme YgiQ (UPF0313 family)
MRTARQQEGIKKVHVASGIRMDLAQRDETYLRELSQHHVGGLLKVAPEHADPEVLRLMKKPGIDDFAAFSEKFRRASAEAGKKQHLVPYFIAGHPGSDLHAMIALAQFLKRTGFRPDKVQDFIASPMDIATCMYYTGIEPITGEEVYVARSMRERKLQRALLQFFKPENYFDVREALLEAGRDDLVGDGPECLIKARPPRSLEKKKPPRRATPEGFSAAAPCCPPPAAGYRPHRKTSQRRERGKG